MLFRFETEHLKVTGLSTSEAAVRIFHPRKIKGDVGKISESEFQVRIFTPVKLREMWARFLSQNFKFAFSPP